MNDAPSSYKLDIPQLIDDLGGTTACQRRLLFMGIDVAKSTLTVAKRRGHLNTQFLANLMAHQALFGPAPVDLNKYLIREEDPAKARRARRSQHAPKRAPAAPSPSAQPR